MNALKYHEAVRHRPDLVVVLPAPRGHIEDVRPRRLALIEVEVAELLRERLVPVRKIREVARDVRQAILEDRDRHELQRHAVHLVCRIARIPGIFRYLFCQSNPDWDHLVRRRCLCPGGRLFRLCLEDGDLALRVDGLRLRDDLCRALRVDEAVVRLARRALDGEETRLAEFLPRRDERPVRDAACLCAQHLLADHAAAERLNSPIQLLGMIRKQHGLPPSALVFLRENPDKTSCPPASQPASRACAAAHC